MTKRFLFYLFIFTCTAANSLAQDTSAYEIQRKKINNLLAQRSSRFGQYDASLNERTGIFGFQTKRDIRNSNEILRQIAITDNDIFTELKVLLDYKDLQVEQVRNTAISNSENILNYRKTIKTLQDNNQKLEETVKHTENTIDLLYLLLILVLVACATLGYMLKRKSALLNKIKA